MRFARTVIMAGVEHRCDVCYSIIRPRERYVADVKEMRYCFSCADGNLAFTYDGFGNKVKVRIKGGKMVC